MTKIVLLLIYMAQLGFCVELSLSRDPPEINGLHLWKVAKIKDDIAKYNPDYQKEYLAIALGVVSGLDCGSLINEMIASHSIYKTSGITSYLLKCKSGNEIRLTAGPFGWYAKMTGKAEFDGLYYSALSVTMLYKDKWDYWSRVAETSINQGNQKTDGALLRYIRCPTQELEKIIGQKYGITE